MVLQDIREVFNGLTEYNIERTYLMAKNIMENENIHDEYAYYDIGTNIMTYTPGKDGSDYLLIDFQRVKLKEPLRNEKGEWTNEDTDGDGELDRYELTDGDATKKVDITGFIKKMVEDELYGNDSAYIRSLATDVDKLAYQAEKKERINSTLAKVKYNIYKERENFYEANIDNNKMDWKEWSENYMHVDDATLTALRGLTTESEKIERLKSDNAKIEVELWKYKSNPTLKDTDFDGLVDTGTTDPMKKSGEITGTINYINNEGSEVIKDTMDYRYFYLNNKMYYDELARMSLIMSNAVTKGTGGINYDMNHIDSAMRGIGMTAEYSNVSSGSHSVSIAIGHREIEYDNIKKNVILVSVSAARNLTEYQGFSKVGNSNWTNDNNNNVNHYEAYEKLSKAAYDKLKAYITSHSLSENVTYWVTGYGTGGGVANLLSARIIDTPPVSTSIVKISNAIIFGYGSTTIGRMVDSGNTNVYAYTFGSPNVVYFDNQPEMINAAKYKSIFNVVDTSDVFAHLPSVKSGWGKYGWNMIPNGNYDKCKDIIDTYSRVFDDIDNKRDIIATTSLDDNVLFYLYTAWAYNELTNDTMYFNGIRTFYNKYYASYKDLEPKHSIKNYYSLCKKILPEHMTVGDGWVDIKSNELADATEFINAIETVGNWYIHHVYTYQGAHKYKNEIETMAQSAHPEARDIWDARKASISDTEFAMKSINDEVNSEGNYKNNDAIYDCDLFDELNYDKKEAVDDCSKFATAVYYYYYNQIGQDTLANQMDLKYTGSARYSKVTNYITEKLQRDKRFKVYIWDDIKDVEDFDLHQGDLIYRRPKTDGNTTLKSGHVEFYLGDNKVFGWGRIHDTFDIDKTFTKGTDGFYSDDTGDCYNGESQPYVTVIRYKGGNE